MTSALEMASAVGRGATVIVAVWMTAVVIMAVALVPARRNTPASAAGERKNDDSSIKWRRGSLSGL